MAYAKDDQKCNFFYKSSDVTCLAWKSDAFLWFNTMRFRQLCPTSRTSYKQMLREVYEPDRSNDTFPNMLSIFSSFQVLDAASVYVVTISGSLFHHLVYFSFWIYMYVNFTYLQHFVGQLQVLPAFICLESHVILGRWWVINLSIFSMP